MSILQVKNLPDELHRALSERARSQGISMSEYVTRLLRRDLSRLTMQEWTAEQRTDPTVPRPIDVVSAMEEVRDSYDPDERVSRAAQAHTSSR